MMTCWATGSTRRHSTADQLFSCSLSGLRRTATLTTSGAWSSTSQVLGSVLTRLSHAWWWWLSVFLGVVLNGAILQLSQSLFERLHFPPSRSRGTRWGTRECLSYEPATRLPPLPLFPTAP